MLDQLTHLQMRPAEPDDIALLNEIAFRSKAYWGYAPSRMESWRAELAVSPVWVSMQWAQVAVADDVIAGFFVIRSEAEQWRLEQLFVEPKAIRRGVGRALVTRACRLAFDFGAVELLVDSDPNAEGFYLACGAERIGSRAAPIESAPLRTLPVLRFQRSKHPAPECSQTPIQTT